MSKQTRVGLILAGIAAIMVVMAGAVLIFRSLDRQEAAVTPTPLALNPTETPTPLSSSGASAASPEPAASPSPLQTSQPTPTPEGPREFYVSPDGSPRGDGSRAAPWDLQTALDHPPAVHPGDTIWVLGGQYTGAFLLKLKGSADLPIIVRAAPGERAILDGTVKVLTVAESAYTWLWGLEITNLRNERVVIDIPGLNDGVFVDQRWDSTGIRFINLIVHDVAGMGFGFWRTARDAEIYGSLIYYNGVNQFDHGIYTQNDDGEKRILDNIIFDNASHGISAYGSEDAFLNNYVIEGNTAFNNGSIGFDTARSASEVKGRNILLGGNALVHNARVVSNYTYLRTGYGTAFNLGYRAGFENALVEDNYFMGGNVVFGGSQSGLTFEDNQLFAVSTEGIVVWNQPDNTWLVARPEGLKIFVEPNQYEPGRANVTVFNWQDLDTVSLSAEQLGGVEIQPGDTYELRNAQNYFDDVISGVYDGSAIEIPMTGHQSAVPLGMGAPPPDSFPRFGAFVLQVVQP